MRYLWLATLLACSCTTARVHVEQGIASKEITFGKWSEESAEVLITSVRLEQEFQIVGPFHGIAGVGPSVILPLDGRAEAAALDVVGQVVYTGFILQPYLLLGTGLFYASETWEPQGSDWGFILQGGVGVRYELVKGHWVNVDYRQWHESNGSKLFGHNYRPNPGVEGGVFSFGYAVDFQ